MIGCTRLVIDASSGSERSVGSKSLHYEGDHGPVIVWNVTRQCNLACPHCYIDADSLTSTQELTGDEARLLIDDAATLRSPIILLSGGEPLMRDDIFDLSAYAVSRGLRVGLSTNGTLITQDVAKRIAETGISYVGVSIDGTASTHDAFRKREGSFAAAIKGLEKARDVGIKTGIRFTVNKHNVLDLPAVTDLLIAHRIPRFCLYHLVYAGRAHASMDIANEQRVQMMDYLIKRVPVLAQRGIEVLTTDNHADGIYIMQSTTRTQTEDQMRVLRGHGGCTAGQKIINIDPEGNVRPCQFWQNDLVGNIRTVRLTELWEHPNELLTMLRNKKENLTGRCGACAYVDVCGGCRVRASAAGDLWGDDPSCYLSDIGVRGDGS
ncbi:MAG: radical SAM protein [Halobacteriota archaeon]